MKIALKDFIALIDDNTVINVYECKVFDGKIKSATKLNSEQCCAVELKIWPCRLQSKYMKMNVISVGNRRQSGGYEVLEILIGECQDKFAELKGFEEEYGIDSLLLLKAMSYGIYYMSYNNTIKHLRNTELSFLPSRFMFGWDYDPSFIYFKNYGKKELGGWALTKEELR